MSDELKYGLGIAMCLTLVLVVGIIGISLENRAPESVPCHCPKCCEVEK